MKVSVIFEDKSITIDGKGLAFAGDDASYFDTVVNTEGHGTAHALQWDSDLAEGDLEVTGESNVAISAATIQPYIDLHAEQKQRIKDRALDSADADEMARNSRNYLLAETDWWGVADRTMSQAEIDYRQALRDLPSDTANWNPVVVWNEEFEYATYEGVNFPEKP